MRVLAVLMVLSSPVMAQVPDVNPYGNGTNFGDADCHTLRETCLHKRELGDIGHSSCQHYRQFCRNDHYVTRTPGY